MAAHQFSVTTKHPAGHMDGTHTFEVRESVAGGTHAFYAVAKGFGCSKDCATPERAVREMCAEHACSIVKLEFLATLATA